MKLSMENILSKVSLLTSTSFMKSNKVSLESLYKRYLNHINKEQMLIYYLTLFKNN